MADQIKEQDPKQATPADSSSDQTQAGPSPSSELKEEDSKKHGPRRTSVFLYLAVLFAAAFTMLFMAYLMQQRANDAAIDSLQDSLTSFESIDELLNENQLATMEQSTYGSFITGVNGVMADSDKQQWWHIAQNGADAQVGADSLAIADGDTIVLTLKEGY